MTFEEYIKEYINEYDFKGIVDCMYDDYNDKQQFNVVVDLTEEERNRLYVMIVEMAYARAAK